jgi:hypothetical protein
MEAREFKITLSDGSTKLVRTTALVFYDEDGESQRLSAADVKTVIRPDQPRVRVGAI